MEQHPRNLELHATLLLIHHVYLRLWKLVSKGGGGGGGREGERERGRERERERGEREEGERE